MMHAVDPFCEHMAAVAEELLGKPVRKSGLDWRYGRNSSLSVDIGKGVFKSFEDESVKGGVLDLIITFVDGVNNHGQAAEWMRRRGYPFPDHRRQGPKAQSLRRLILPKAEKPKNADTAGGKAEIVGPAEGEWRYTNEDDEVLFRVLRFRLSNGKKTFKQHRADGEGGWLTHKGNMDGIRLVPYALPEVLKAIVDDRDVYIGEGEKVANRLRVAGLCATTNPMGACKWGNDTKEGQMMAAALNLHFRGARIIILPDNDEVGRKHARLVAKTLENVAESIHVLELPGLASKEDVVEWLDVHGHSVEELLELKAQAVPGNEYTAEPIESREQNEPVPIMLELIDPTTLESLPVPSREWHVEPLIPHRTVTLLSGDGGTGKSLLALQLAMATALGSSWIGREVAAGRALFVTVEDDKDEAHRRMYDICVAEGVRFRDLGNLRIAPLAGLDAVLAAPKGKTGLIEETPLWAALMAECEAFRPRLLVLDPSADLYAGEENNRSQVRQFIGMLRGPAINLNMTVVLLSHPSLTGLTSGSGSSGSTAWNNSVRSRLYFRRATASDGNEPDPDLRVLENKKANYSRTGSEVVLRWQAGRFVPEKGSTASAFDRVAAETQADTLFLELLQAFSNQGRHVSSKPGPSYAPHLLSKDPRASGTSKRALEAAMQRLFVAQRICLESFGPPSRQVTRLVPSEPKARE